MAIIHRLNKMKGDGEVIAILAVILIIGIVLVLIFAQDFLYRTLWKLFS